MEIDDRHGSRVIIVGRFRMMSAMGTIFLGLSTWRWVKKGGRVKGTPNKETLAVAERLEAIGCDPIEGMARIAMDITTPIEVRAKLYGELAQYIAPKRKAVEHTGDPTATGAALGVICPHMKAPRPEAVTERP